MNIYVYKSACMRACVLLAIYPHLRVELNNRGVDRLKYVCPCVANVLTLAPMAVSVCESIGNHSIPSPVT